MSIATSPTFDVANFTGTLGAFILTPSSAPSNDYDVANKKYVDDSIPVVSDIAYNATTWDANTDAATKNAIRDKIETMDTAIGLNTSKTTESTTVSDTNTVDLTLTTYDITADVLYQNSTTIDLSDDASGLKADLDSTLKTNYD